MKQNVQIVAMTAVLVSATVVIRLSDGIKRAAHTGAAILGIGSSPKDRRPRTAQQEEM